MSLNVVIVNALVIGVQRGEGGPHPHILSHFMREGVENYERG